MGMLCPAFRGVPSSEARESQIQLNAVERDVPKAQ